MRGIRRNESSQVKARPTAMVRMQQCLFWALVALQTCAAAPRTATGEDGMAKCDFDKIVKCLEKQVRWIPKIFTEWQPSTSSIHGDNAFFRKICRRKASECWKDNKSYGCPAQKQASLDRFRDANTAALTKLCENDMSLLKDLYANFQSSDIENFKNCSKEVGPSRVGELFSVARPLEDCRAYEEKMLECVQESYQQGTEALWLKRKDRNATEALWRLLDVFFSHMNCEATSLDQSPRQGDLSTPTSSRNVPCSTGNRGRSECGNATQDATVGTTSEILLFMRSTTATKNPEKTSTSSMSGTDSSASSRSTRKSTHFDSSVTEAAGSTDYLKVRVRKRFHVENSSKTEDEDQGVKHVDRGTSKPSHLTEPVIRVKSPPYTSTPSDTTGKEKDVTTLDGAWSPHKSKYMDTTVAPRTAAHTTATLANTDATTEDPFQVAMDNAVGKSRTEEKQNRLEELSTSRRAQFPVTSPERSLSFTRAPFVLDIEGQSTLKSEGIIELSNVSAALNISATGEEAAETGVTHREPHPVHITAEDKGEATVQNSASSEDEHPSETSTRRSEPATASSTLSIATLTTSLDNSNTTKKLFIQASTSHQNNTFKETENHGHLSVYSSLATSTEVSTAASLHTGRTEQTLLTSSGYHKTLPVTEKGASEKPIVANEKRKLEAKAVISVTAHIIPFSVIVFPLVTMCFCA
ncbi:uncharacterized protein LOC144124685 [Amblyomma americanum]